MDPIKWKIERQWKVIPKQQEKPQGTLKGGGGWLTDKQERIEGTKREMQMPRENITSGDRQSCSYSAEVRQMPRGRALEPCGELAGITRGLMSLLSIFGICSKITP